MKTSQHKTMTGWMNAAAAWLMGVFVERVARFLGERDPGLRPDRIAIRVHPPVASKPAEAGNCRPSRHR